MSEPTPRPAFPASGSSALPLAAGELYAIPNVYELDGMVYTHPLAARGYASMNTYVLVEPDQALVVDTGYTVHQASLIASLTDLLGAGAPASIWALRIGEFHASCNIRPIMEEFAVDALYCTQHDGPVWVDFRPEYAPYGAPTGVGHFDRVRSRKASRGDVIPVGSGGREVIVVDAALRLIPTSWGYDARTRTLFTSDAFTHLWSDVADGPWIVGDEQGSGYADEVPTAEAVLDYLENTRFWWLPGARTDRLRRDIDEIFSQHEVETIAPGYGCVIAGKAAVDRHVGLLDEALRLAGRRRSIGLEVGTRKARVR